MLKEALPEEMISGIRLVAKGRSYFDPAVMQLVVNNKQGKDPLGELTEREQEVLAALGEGLSNKQIADKLYVTEYTIKKHVSSVLGKLGLKDRTQAALFAAKLS